MKHLPSSTRHRLAMLATGLGLVLWSVPAAHAFTIDNQSNTNADGSARYTDPDAQFSSGSNGQTTFHAGGATFQFGQGQSFDQRYNPSNLFNPNGRPGDDR